MNKCIVAIIVIALCVCEHLIAQDMHIHSEVTSNLGKHFTSSGLNMTLTMGEPIVGKAVADIDSPSLLQGFQPTLASISTSVESIEQLQFEFGIHPIPSREYVTITLSKALDADHMLSLFSEAGHLIAEWQMIEGELLRQLKLPSLSSGWYHLQLSDKQAKRIAYKHILIN